MPPAVWMFVGVMVALTVVPVAITISDALNCRRHENVVARGRSQNAHFRLRPHIGKGVHILPHGLAYHEEEWTVSAPTLRTVSESNGRTHYVFGMRLPQN
jgi:hypothetical protein